MSAPRRGMAGREVWPVVVVGAGPTGVCAALLLARHGVDALVVERHPDVYPLPRAVHFDDEIFRVFQALGLEDAVRAISRPMLGMQLLDRNHGVLAELNRDPGGGIHGHPEANMFDQPELEGVLRAALARVPGAALVGRTEVVAVEQDRSDGPAPVRVTLQPLDGGEPVEVWTHAVLGCDGANGRSRAWVGTTMRDLGFQQRWLVIDVRSPVPLGNWDGVHQVCDPQRPATYMEVGRGRHRWEFMVGPDEDETALARPDVLRALTAPWCRQVDVDALEVLRQATYTFRSLIARRWRRGRVFLLGDAAHQTPPFIGQGMCAGIRDAVNLAWKLALVLQGRADDRLLETYQAERLPHATWLIALAVSIGRVMIGGGPWSSALRDRLLPVIDRVDWLKARLTRQGAAALAAGPLVQRTRLADWTPGVARRLLPAALPLDASAAGLLVPQHDVTAPDGARVRLDDLLGTGFVLLAVGTAPPRDVEGRAFWDALGLRTVVVDGPLAGWLAAHGAGAALVRPDRVVAAAGRDADLPAWRRMLETAGVRAPAPAPLAAVG